MSVCDQQQQGASIEDKLKYGWDWGKPAYTDGVSRGSSTCHTAQQQLQGGGGQQAARTSQQGHSRGSESTAGHALSAQHVC